MVTKTKSFLICYIFLLSSCAQLSPPIVKQNESKRGEQQSTLSVEQDEYKRKNNSWYKYSEDSDTVIVFVHGILGDSAKTWLDEDENVYWPELIKNDTRFDGVSIYLGGYFTGIDSTEYGPTSATKELWSAIKTNNHFDNKKPVISKDNIIFVCHSTGGIIVRNLLIHHREYFKNKVVGLVLIASPSYGSKWANRLTPVIDVYKNELAKTLKYGSFFLEQLDDDFKDMRQENSIPNLIGSEALEHHPLWHKWYWPFGEVIVTKESGNRYFDTQILPNTDHFSSVKPDSLDHPSYVFLLDFYLGKFRGKVITISQDFLEELVHKKYLQIITEFEKQETDKHKISGMLQQLHELIDQISNISNKNLSRFFVTRKYQILSNIYLISSMLSKENHKLSFANETIKYAGKALDCIKKTNECEYANDVLNSIQIDPEKKQNPDDFKNIVLEYKLQASAIKAGHTMNDSAVKAILSEIDPFYLTSERKNDIDRDLKFSKFNNSK